MYRTWRQTREGDGEEGRTDTQDSDGEASEEEEVLWKRRKAEQVLVA